MRNKKNIRASPLLKGKVYRLYDEAGRVVTAEYDFKGNPLSSTRKVIDPALFSGPQSLIVPP